jgi:hypothetical protein
VGRRAYHRATDGSPVSSRKTRLAKSAGAVLTVLAVWLGWQVIREVIIIQGPPEMAVRVAPGSASALRRRASDAVLASEPDDAARLARSALQKAPFSSEALRIIGLIEAGSGRRDAADDILTLAGNLSLRDNASHIWLVENRLRRGDYASSFAHADVLARRREELHSSIFELFTVAGLNDPPALQALIGRLDTKPPWRAQYLRHILRTERGRVLASVLAFRMESTAAPFTNEELAELYIALVSNGEAVKARDVRLRVRRPSLEQPIVNGDFSASSGPRPFAWSEYSQAGLVAERIEDGAQGDGVLRVEYNGFVSGVAAEQLLVLTPGVYTLTGRSRAETTGPNRLAWQVTCLDRRELGVAGGPTLAVAGEWVVFSAKVEVPTFGCEAQWLRLRPTSGGQLSPTVTWYDDLVIGRAVLEAGTEQQPGR